MHTKSILVVGGAGYIGSHMVLKLQEHGYNPIVLDNLSTGHRDAVVDAQFIHGDMADTVLLDQIFSVQPILAVMHFASHIEVGESVRDPGKYYQNNVVNTLCLLRALLKWDIKKFIFSSSAAVYGEPHYTPIDEQHPLLPVNPYGRTKLIVEQMLQDFAVSDGLRYAALRYFNAAGADPQGRVSERHAHESHLIPLILQAARGERAALTVYGRDYATVDGTCVRDYVHVDDLCAAHLLVLQALLAGGESKIYNLGTGSGYSVQQVIDVARKVTGCEIVVEEGVRRAGDPAVLVADASSARRELGWEPKFGDVGVIIGDAWGVRE